MRYRFMRYPGGKPKAVTFSYDDACRQDIRLSQLFNKYNLKGTFNINSAFIAKNDGEWHLTEKEIKENIIDKGHEVATHGEYHKANGVIRLVEGIQDVINCRRGLEDKFGMIIRGMAYPDSGIRIFHNQTTMSDIATYLKSLDIVYARTLGEVNKSFNLPADWYQWMPTGHHNDSGLLDLIDEFVSYEVSSVSLSRAVPKLLYIWGHAYEFDKMNNWDRMEQICEKLSNRDDTWYATNIEIYEYVEAYNSLIFSADSNIIYNPTLKKIWFEVDDKPYTIEAGETIKIN